ncbi:hypothetical protein EMIT043CA1_160080 [Pseudomonas brassicacearum]
MRRLTAFCLQTMDRKKGDKPRFEAVLITSQLKTVTYPHFFAAFSVSGLANATAHTHLGHQSASVYDADLCCDLIADFASLTLEIYRAVSEDIHD